MSKHSLMLSTAAVALLAGTAMAETKIDSSKTEAYTTGALLSGNTGQANAGNITITSAGSVSSTDAQGALTVDTSNWILAQGSISSKKDAGSAIHVDMSTNPDLSGASFQNAASATITGTGIYLDNSSSTTASGSSTIGIFLDSASCTSTGSCTYKGAINLSSGSVLSVTGDKSTAVQIGTSNGYGTMVGDLTFAGTATASASTTSNTTTTMFGLRSLGKIDGDVVIASGGTLAAYGHGAVGMSIEGYGVTKSLTIGGSLVSSILSDTNYNYNQKINTTTNPEAGPALRIGASIGKGVEILGATSAGTSTATGSVSMEGSGPAIYVGPGVNGSVTQTTNLTIGVYTDTADPGFSFYNRGSVAASFSNYNKSTTAMEIEGTSTLPTIFTGGIYNSGSMAASATTSNDISSSSSVNVIGLYIGSYVNLLENASAKNPGTGGDPGDKAALVISGLSSASSGGSVTASISGTKGGTARAIYIASNASVPSIINSGTISAQVTTTDATLTGSLGSTTPVAAIAIWDDSGSLTSITNSGTISAVAGYVAGSSNSASALDNDAQTAVAIKLGGSASSNSANGISIKNYSSASRAAVIVGDIYFGTGNNQVLDMQGNGPTLASVVTGNVTFGMVKDTSLGGSGDHLIVGSYSVLTGKVTTQETVRGYGVAVDVATHGTLNLLNTDTALNATTVKVASGGTLNLGVNRSLTSGGVVAAQSVSFADDANLGVTYASYVPQSTKQFVLMTAQKGQLSINQSVIDVFNNAKDTNGNSKTPYLLKTASMCSTTNSNCARPTDLPSTQDALLINVETKNASELGLAPDSVAARPITTTNGVATTLFEQANLALGIDNTLGAAFINGIADAKQAARAYNDMAPNTTGGTRAIAISITDSASGPVAARQRALRMYGKTDGDMTIWGQEFVQMMKDPGTGATDPNTGFKTNPGYKDHGFGFSVGVDGGSPKYGWYGGALTFYAGDVNELARDAHVNEQWYVLSLYSSWRGKGLFIDSKVDAGYGNIDGKRSIALVIPNGSSYSIYSRTAENKHAGALVSGSVATGAMFTYGAATLMPQINFDGMMLREEGYTEKNPGTTTVGDGFDLKVNQYYAKSLRAFVGFNARYDLNLWDFFLQPEARAGYRYDFFNDPAKIKAAFAYANVTTNSVGPGDTFTLEGPEPSQGAFVVGGSLAATTDSWTLGLNFDFVRSSNGAFQQVGTLHLLGRI